jgi:hypothetical protein
MNPRLDPFKDFDPAQTVQVLPRYLAGPGPVELHTIWPFPFDEGWHLHPSADEGMVFAISPCARLWTRFAPDLEKPGKGTGIIAANRIPFGPRAWGITFDATTPAELLHDVHAELLDLYLESRHSDKDYLFGDDVMAPHEVYTPLLARGWSHSVKTDGTQTFRSPDGLSSVRHRYTIRRLRRSDLAGLRRIPERTVLAGTLLTQRAHRTRRGLHRLARLRRAAAPHRAGRPVPHPQPPLRRHHCGSEAAAQLLTRPSAGASGRWPDPMTSHHLIKEHLFPCTLVSSVAPSDPLPSPPR